MEKPIPIKRKEMGIAGAVILLGQFASQFSSTQSLSGEIEKVRNELHGSEVLREEYFVRKTDIGALSQKIDSVRDQLDKLKEQVTALQNSRRMKEDYTSISAGEDIIGCDFREEGQDTWMALKI